MCARSPDCARVRPFRFVLKDLVMFPRARSPFGSAVAPSRPSACAASACHRRLFQTAFSAAAPRRLETSVRLVQLALANCSKAFRMGHAGWLWKPTTGGLCKKVRAWRKPWCRPSKKATASSRRSSSSLFAMAPNRARGSPASSFGGQFVNLCPSPAPPGMH